MRDRYRRLYRPASGRWCTRCWLRFARRPGIWCTLSICDDFALQGPLKSCGSLVLATGYLGTLESRVTGERSRSRNDHPPHRDGRRVYRRLQRRPQIQLQRVALNLTLRNSCETESGSHAVRLSFVELARGATRRESFHGDTQDARRQRSQGRIANLGATVPGSGKRQGARTTTAKPLRTACYPALMP